MCMVWGNINLPIRLLSFYQLFVDRKLSFKWDISIMITSHITMINGAFIVVNLHFVVFLLSCHDHHHHCRHIHGTHKLIWMILQQRERIKRRTRQSFNDRIHTKPLNWFLPLLIYTKDSNWQVKTIWLFVRLLSIKL